MNQKGYCYCGREDDWDDVIMCDHNSGCEGWYHYTCENLSESSVSTIEQYACKGCVAAGTARTTYKGDPVDGDGEGTAEVPAKQQSSITRTKRKASAQCPSPYQGHKKVKRAGSDDHPMPGQQDEVAQNIRRSSAPGATDTNTYKRIVDKLNVDLQYLQGYDASDAQRIVPSATANIQARLDDILNRNQAIQAQVGLIEVMRLDEADFAAIRAHPKAAEEFLEAHLERVIEVQQDQIKELGKEIQKLEQEEPGSRPFLFDLWKMFGFEQPGSVQVDVEVDRTD